MSLIFSWNFDLFWLTLEKAVTLVWNLISHYIKEIMLVNSQEIRCKIKTNKYLYWTFLSVAVKEYYFLM